MIRKDIYGNVLEKGIYFDKHFNTYIYKFIDDKYKSRSIRAKSLPQLYERIESLKNSGVIPMQASDEPTLDACFYDNLRHKRNVTSSYLVKLRRNYENHVKPRLGSLLIKDITHDDIVLLYKDLYDTGLAVRTIENIHLLVSNVFKTAARNDIIKKDITFGAFYSNFSTSDINQRNRRDKYLSFDETDKLFFEIQKRGRLQDIHIASVLFGTGMRLGELVGLRWENIDFKNRAIYVDHQLAVRYKVADLDKAAEENSTVHTININDKTNKRTKQRQFDDNLNKTISEILSDNIYKDNLYWDIMDGLTPEYEYSETKTPESNRMIPMIDDVYAALRDEYRIQQRYEIKCAETFGGFNDFIFIDVFGKVRKHSYIFRMLDTYVNAYNRSQDSMYELYGFEPKYLKHISPHMARHTFCSRLSVLADNPKFVQEIMGHGSYRTTAEIYNEVTSEVLIKTLSNQELKLI